MADEARLPTEEEIAQLPRWARVAFAARCARRVLPLFEKVWNDGPEVDREPVKLERARLDLMICRVENAASRCIEGLPNDNWLSASKVRDVASRAWNVGRREAHNWAIIGKPLIRGYAAFGEIAGRVANSVAGALDAITPASPTGTIKFTLMASHDAAFSLPNAKRGLILADLHELIELSAKSGWTDDTPVPPSVFGPIDDTIDNPAAKSLVLKLHYPEGTSPHDIGDAVVKLWEAANEYHMARGGGVLTFDEFKQMMPALVPVGPKLGS